MSYKTIDGLMRHLRDSNIQISGSLQKRKLMNTGYFHGYKGYRFFKTSQRRLPFVSYDEIYATIQYDAKLKAIFYDKIMFIETALKNIALSCILKETNSESIQDMYDKVVNSYNNAPTGSDQKKLQQNKLNLQSTVQSYLSRAYKAENPKIAHFYNNMSYSDVPIWALMEIMMMGDFGFLISCLTYNMRDSISHSIGINVSSDTYRELVYKYIYTLKDLRNAIAHNDVVFDTRFSRIEPTRAMRACLQQEIGLPYVNFKSIGDYVILICYYLKLFKVSKIELKAFIREFETITNEYKSSVSLGVSTIVIHPDLVSRMNTLKKFI